MKISAKQLFVLLGLAVLLAAIPLTIFLTRQRQELRGRAAAATTVYFSPATVTVAVNQNFSLQIMINTTTNRVTAAAIRINYEKDKLRANSLRVTPVGGEPEAFLPEILLVSEINNAVGYATITLGSGPTAHQGTGRLATIEFRTLNLIAGTLASVTLAGTQVAAVDEPGNVARQLSPATINIITPTPTPTLTPTPRPTNTPTPTPIFTPSPTPTPAPANLTFNVAFQGITGITNRSQPPSKNAQVTLKPTAGGQQIGPLNITLTSVSPNWVYTGRLTNIPRGTYDVYIKGWAHLQRKFASITLNSGENTQDFTGVVQKAGDIVLVDVLPIINYNRVNIYDYNLLVSQFGRNMPPGGLADLDLDNDVDIFDYNLLVGNFNQRGDE